MGEGVERDRVGAATKVSADVIDKVAQQTDTKPETVRKVVQKIERYERHVVEGPLPPPEYLAGYESACAGSAQTIINMAVSALEHSQQMERDALRSEVTYRLVGIGVAAAVLIIMVAGAVGAAAIGNTAAAVTLGSAAGLASVVGVFVRGRNLFGKGAEQSGLASPREGTATPDQSPPAPDDP